MAEVEMAVGMAVVAMVAVGAGKVQEGVATAVVARLEVHAGGAAMVRVMVEAGARAAVLGKLRLCH